MDTSANLAALSDDSNADISGVNTPTPTSDAASATAGDTSTSADTSRNQIPAGSNTPTGEVPGRDRSGTIIARPIWDATTTQLTSALRALHVTRRGRCTHFEAEPQKASKGERRSQLSVSFPTTTITLSPPEFDVIFFWSVEAVLESRVRDWLHWRSARADTPRSMMMIL